MSDKDADAQEPDAVHECPVDWCEYVSQSKQGALNHFGPSHDDGVKREVYLDELQRLADELGRTPRAEDMDAHGEYSTSAYERAFNSWNKALETAGLEINSAYNISRDDLVEELRRLADELGRTPRQEDMAEHGIYGKATYWRHFESWNDALEVAGFNPNRVADIDGISDEELIADLRRLADTLGHTPRMTDMTEHGRYSVWPYICHFGSWNAALEAAGLDPNHRNDISDKELLDELRRLHDELGRTPRSSDMVERGEYSVPAYFARFGSWSAALEASGLEPHSHEDWILSGEDHPFYNGGDTPYGPGWNDRKKELVRERDGRKCQHCGRSEKEHVRIHGTKHAVHHIQKARAFDDPKQRNRTDNLVTLCRVTPDGGDRPCHKVWEDMSPLRPYHSD